MYQRINAAGVKEVQVHENPQQERPRLERGPTQHGVVYSTQGRSSRLESPRRRIVPRRRPSTNSRPDAKAYSTHGRPHSKAYSTQDRPDAEAYSTQGRTEAKALDAGSSRREGLPDTGSSLETSRFLFLTIRDLKQHSLHNVLTNRSTGIRRSHRRAIHKLRSTQCPVRYRCNCSSWGTYTNTK